MEIDPCVQLVVEDFMGRGVGNLAHLSQTGFDGGGALSSLIDGSSSSIEWGTALTPGIGGGGGSIVGPPGGGNGGGNGNGGNGKDVIPEPSGLMVWLLLFFFWRMYVRK